MIGAIIKGSGLINFSTTVSCKVYVASRALEIYKYEGGQILIY
jgi:hypothetical protein